MSILRGLEIRKLDNRWFLWTVTILIGSGLVLLSWIFQTIGDLEQQASENFFIPRSSSWRIFRSSTLGISVRYPASWQIEVDPLEANALSLQNPNDFNENILISAVEPELEKVIRESLKLKMVTEQTVVIDGKPGQWLRSSSDLQDPATSNVILVRKENKLYYIAGSAKFFEKIVTSIRFY